MKTVEICKIVDEFFSDPEFNFQLCKSGEVISFLLKNNKGGEAEFCKVGSVYGFRTKGIVVEIDKSDLTNILSPYLGSRLLILM